MAPGPRAGGRPRPAEGPVLSSRGAGSWWPRVAAEHRASGVHVLPADRPGGPACQWGRPRGQLRQARPSRWPDRFTTWVSAAAEPSRRLRDAGPACSSPAGLRLGPLPAGPAGQSRGPRSTAWPGSVQGGRSGSSQPLPLPRRLQQLAWRSAGGPPSERGWAGRSLLSAHTLWPVCRARRPEEGSAHPGTRPASRGRAGVPGATGCAPCVLSAVQRAPRSPPRRAELTTRPADVAPWSQLLPPGSGPRVQTPRHSSRRAGALPPSSARSCCLVPGRGLGGLCPAQPSRALDPRCGQPWSGSLGPEL